MSEKPYTILDKICEKKREELNAAKEKMPFAEIFELARHAPDGPSFKDALKKNGDTPAVIAELKKASPSAGVIRENFDHKTLAVQLEAAGASALSVLTERNFFLGSPDYLKDAVSLVKIPVIRKDFIFNQYQICEAKIWGASAVLLIAAMLTPEEFTWLYNIARGLGLDVLAEAHDAGEIDMLLACGADIIGVNCRNLKTFDTDSALAEKLMGRIPSGIVKVSESAMRSRQDLLRAGNAGADAALIGTALMSQENPALELEKLLGKA